MAIMSQFSDMMSQSIFFWCCLVSLVKFSSWSKFYVNIITDSGVITISFSKGLTEVQKSCLSFAQYLEIGASKEYQIWHKCPGLNLSFCSTIVKINLIITLWWVYKAYSKFCQSIGQYISYSHYIKFVVSHYRFSGPTNTNLFKFSSINSGVKCEICLELTI